jgi:hypothetical protein
MQPHSVRLSENPKLYLGVKHHRCTWIYIEVTFYYFEYVNNTLILIIKYRYSEKSFNIYSYYQGPRIPGIPQGIPGKRISEFPLLKFQRLKSDSAVVLLARILFMVSFYF